ncbi:hypothetical protein [Mycobacterium interjectum]|uniref:hypothetical protein n=1 Tax=Mycobacterium interjectum TaxID=33895 RepID=UPI001155FB60|nr:hypothetical protein [Mycobacterium interjectum]MCV7091824.1 hypothetical protein [Mycobacterium interjectum]
MIPTLNGHSSMLVTITAHGLPDRRPAGLVIRVSGQSASGSTVALATIDLVDAQPALSLTLAGNSRLTDSSPASLVAIIGNSSDVPITVSVRATAGRNEVRLAVQDKDGGSASVGSQLNDLQVDARQSKLVQIQVNARPPVRRGTTAVVVTTSAARQPGVGEPYAVTASRDLEVALATDVLPGVIGLSSVLIIPGLLAVWALLSVLGKDRLRIGLQTGSVGKQILDNKLWLLGAAAVSCTAAPIYAALGFSNLFDTYTLSDIFIISVATGVIGYIAGRVIVHEHRRRVAVVNDSSSPFEVLEAAAKAGSAIPRKTYKTPEGQRGLLVHTDWKAPVLTPQINYSKSLQTVIDTGNLANVVETIRANPDFRNDIRFATVDGMIAKPAAFQQQLQAEKEQDILDYKNDPNT